MKNYRCVIWSNSSCPREYIVHTSSAYKTAIELGRCEGGEHVIIKRVKTGKAVSAVVWTAGIYVRVEV